mgnify:CR=1 FL=1
MSERNNFIDYIRIFAHSGHGGAGCRHFLRNKFTAKGGPDGGDGGRGAHIILKGNAQLWTLLHLRYYKNEESKKNTSLDIDNHYFNSRSGLYSDVCISR